MAREPRKVRLLDIANKAGVSRAAVGHILNNSGADCVRVSEATREKVLKIAAELNYRPNKAAQRLRGMPTKIIGVVLDTVNLAVFSARLAAIEAEAHTRGYRLMIGQAHHDPDEIQTYLDDFADHGMDAVLCMFDVMQDFRPKLKKVFRGRDNIILHSSPILKSQPCVRVETSSAIEQLVDHLVDRGRKKIAIQLWSPSDQLMAIRSEAWKDNVKRRKLPSTNSLIWTNPEATQKPSREAIDDCIQQLVITNKADAIIASNDEWAVRLIQGLERHGYSVPKDVAVTGYDNLDIADVIEPGLTTIDQCHAEYAKQALDLVEETISGTITPAKRLRVIHPQLVVREST
ncbi:LacI family DNA-binding transcriptional regulator [Bremerella sp. T1]|uniref:LacI family DNA-binding transcriptional regulator n=1 Tax=Bremerella sp. TYQ1 TaxID=3119568 RepID=UPI001CCA72B6|nr:LacI family DNA-binding transcriptional regulator [Bremerella volcania]UBM35433.1 LacI family transcriptional regulator [Bremerella volcania]